MRRAPLISFKSYEKLVLYQLFVCLNTSIPNLITVKVVKREGNKLLLLLLVVVSLMFSGLLSTMLHRVFSQTPGIHMVMYCFYSDFIDSTFLRICAVPRIADLWRL